MTEKEREPEETTTYGVPQTLIQSFKLLVSQRKVNIKSKMLQAITTQNGVLVSGGHSIRLVEVNNQFQVNDTQRVNGRVVDTWQVPLRFTTEILSPDQSPERIDIINGTQISMIICLNDEQAMQIRTVLLNHRPLVGYDVSSSSSSSDASPNQSETPPTPSTPHTPGEEVSR